MRARDKDQADRWLTEPETILADVKAAMVPKRKWKDPMLVHVRVAMDKGRTRALAARKRRSKEIAMERRKARIAAKPHSDPIWRQFINAMEPGGWYRWIEVERAIGMSRGMRLPIMKALTRDRLVERAPNPAWDGRQLPPLVIMAGAVQEPHNLYRLTAAGEAARDQ